MNRNGIKSGVTLLELMITVSVMSVMLLMAYKNFNDSVNSQNLKGTIQQVALAIKDARYYAKAKGDTTHLIFEEGATSYSVEDQDGNAITDSSMYGAMSGELPTGFSVKENTCGDVYFHPDGNPLSAINPDNIVLSSDCNITIGYDDTHTKSVTIHAYSGDATYDY
jgi:prepilin-type N-terminal cleavage/methylation domain-containing protein